MKTFKLKSIKHQMKWILSLRLGWISIIKASSNITVHEDYLKRGSYIYMKREEGEFSLQEK